MRETGQVKLSRRDLVRALVGFIVFLLLVPALLFLAAGTLNWPMAWAFSCLYVAAAVISRLIVWRTSPDTLRERARFTRSEGTNPWDRELVLLVGLLGPVAIAVVAGLDHRLGWSSAVSPAGQVLAAVIVALSYGVGVWAMVVNRFFSAVARLQVDRGQVVVSDGPYRFIRHPAYAGSVVASLAMPFLLDALWALIPALIMVAGVVLRTNLEDRMLQEGLPGYHAYARQTPYRLFPRIW